MKRLRLFVAVAVVMAAMIVFAAAPAMAQDPWWDGGFNVDRITDVDPQRGGGWEVEGEGTFWGRPAEFEWVCDWWECWLVDVDFL